MTACEEEAPEKPADPPEPEQQDDLPPTDVKRSVFISCVVIGIRFTV